MRVEERFLNYVSYWTTSDENGTKNPTSDREFSLAKVLEQELRDMGLEKVRLSDSCYVYGLLPATPGMENKKAIGLIAHMDTAPDFSGENVRPQIIENYNGKDIHLEGSDSWIKVSDFPHLKNLKGHRLITTDGTTLLGADDKAGIAEIMAAIDEVKNSDIPHGDIWVCFTPDEEVGMGPDSFDLDYFGADYAYTVDGGYEGDIAYENFNAASAEFDIKGVSVHPGEAKGIMKNAARIACLIATKLPIRETPAHTEGRQGFFHLTDMSGDVVSAKLSYIIRDHDKNKFEHKKSFIENTVNYLNSIYGENTAIAQIKDSYYNMKEQILPHMHIIENAKKAMQKVGLDPITVPIRGGTDGARLSFMGLPCPNLPTGGANFHSIHEFISIQSMEKMVEVLVEIVKK